ncbi:MAG: endonuclease domain-containing protein [Microbacterium sp.]|uniref:endonuclease domain-containing protein n=1 Tax=Microbacterium sp. TaxID=51671 RepID=UPI003A872BE9
MAARKKTFDDLRGWLRTHEGIAHREHVLRAGFGIHLIRDFVRAGGARRIRRDWIALPSAAADLATAAAGGGRVTCTSLARRRKWFVPESVGTELHLHLVPGSGAARLGAGWPGILHWNSPVAPAGDRTLVAPIEDALAHIAVCQPFDVALVLWESAANREGIAGEVLRGIPFRSPVARRLAESVTGLSDSGLETMVVTPLRRWGVPVRQQVLLAGRPVDVLIGDRLVVQIDGYEFHSSSAQRSRDIAHDAELRLRGYTVLRVSYAQVVHGWPALEATIRRAMAAGLHLAT